MLIQAEEVPLACCPGLDLCYHGDVGGYVFVSSSSWYLEQTETDMIAAQVRFR